eukprot:gnl/TRDRNA2_/TRDRNA2_192900_c0_seq1.p1 gnl/TRDRNA2_/TRDRNA2_192900_c0~~gnl/TRDRNA2_/TRDRNA2_192900_c0_seq1.p1  ORF type:complete len:590 (+),score=163.23 gnl/TRDRNA2_/TRDRNA2_192900_c0_seq1:69-1838(+)
MSSEDAAMDKTAPNPLAAEDQAGDSTSKHVASTETTAASWRPSTQDTGLADTDATFGLTATTLGKNEPPSLGTQQLEAAASTAKDEPSHGLATARHHELMREADEKARHQAAARETMLDLARALEVAQQRRKELEAEVEKEKLEKIKLRAEIDKLFLEIREFNARLEEKDVEIARFKLHGNKTFLTSAMYWGETIAGGQLYCLGDGVGADGEPLTGQLPAFDASEDQKEKARLASEAVTGKRRIRNRTKGDALKLHALFRFWNALCPDGRVERALKVVEEKHKREIEEMNAKFALERKAFEEALERQRIEAEERMKELKEELAVTKHQVSELEKEKLAIQKEAAEKERILNEEIVRLKEELKRAWKEVQEALAALEAMRKERDELEEILRRERLEAAAEIAKLKAQMRDIASELQAALMLAKQMREAALAAKRALAGSISPEKFNELIRELEALRDRCEKIGSEYENEKERTWFLRGQLDRNRRRLELERQFLPLLRQVKGPVGPKNPILNNKGTSASAAKIDGCGSPDKMRMTHSASFSAGDAKNQSYMKGGVALKYDPSVEFERGRFDKFNKTDGFKAPEMCPGIRS